MESSEYRTLYNLETDYWWFRNLHEILVDMLRDNQNTDAPLLDAGCGTGGLMLHLAQLSPQVYGFDISADAAHFWAERGLQHTTTQASINDLPYPANHFGAVVSVDILECEGVEDGQAYAELVRVAKVGGRVIVVVPAYQWMMTEGHHKAVHAVRRYNKTTLRALAAGLPVEIERITHGFAALFPMVGGVRLLNRLEERWHQVAVKSELQPLPPWINQTLYTITNWERHLLRRVNMPFGSSLIMIGRKTEKT